MDIIVDGIIYQCQPYGGIARLYSEILPRMCDFDDSLHIMLLTSGQCRIPLPSHSNIHRISVPPIEGLFRPGRAWRPIMPQIKAFMQLVWMKGANRGVWHSTYYTLPIWWKGSIVVTVLDTIHERFPGFFGKEGFNLLKQKRRCLQRADAIISISNTTAADLQHFYNIRKDKIWVIPLACNIKNKRSGHSEPCREVTKKPFLLYVGMRTHYKNVDLLLKAYSQWRLRTEIDLVVVGRPWSDDQRKELETLGINDKVHLFGYVDNCILEYLYRTAVAFVYPSLYEGFGIPLLEAMECGCPIIASRIPTTVEVARDCPIYFDPLDFDALINAFETALSEGKNSWRVQKGLDQVNQYSWDSTAKQTLEVYRSLS